MQILYPCSSSACQVIYSLLLGGIAGGLIGTPVGMALPVDDRGAPNLFAGALLGAFLSLLGVLLLIVYVPEPHHPTKPAAEASAAAVAEGDKVRMLVLTRRVLQVLVFAGFLDSLGDQGNAFARSIIFANRYPEGKEPLYQMLLVVLGTLGIFVSQNLVLTTTRGGALSLASWCLLGNLASAATQFAVIPATMPIWAFMLCFFGARTFGFTSTLASMFLLPRYAPPESRGYWSGLQGSATTASNALAPILLACLYQALSPPPGSVASEYQRAETVRRIA